MNDFSEALGSAVQGGLIAAAVEPEHGSAASPSVAANCLNCGAALTGAHCHNCGQKAQVHRTLNAFGHDILHSVLHFDGKIWRTVPLLFWNPGELTRRYIHGERAKFVSPIALFLFTVFLTFAVFSWLLPSGSSIDSIVAEDDAAAQYQTDRKAILEKIAELEADKKAAQSEQDPPGSYAWMDGEIARHIGDLKALEADRGKDLRRTELAQRKFALEQSSAETEINRLEAQLNAARAAGKPTAALEDELSASQLQLKLMQNAAGALGKEDPGEGWRFTDAKFSGSDSLNAAFKHAFENPQLVLYKIQSNAYKYSWALIPISIPFVWLLFFWRRRFKMFDHAVFVTYSLTFMMLLGVLSAVLLQFAATEVIGGLALTLLPPIHMYRQLHRAYETSRFGALWRMCLLSLFAVTALTMFAALILTLGVI